MVKVLYVPELPVNFLSMSYFEIDVCGIFFSQGMTYLYPEGVSLYTRVLLGIWSKRLYKVLFQLVVEYSR